MGERWQGRLETGVEGKGKLLCKQLIRHRIFNLEATDPRQAATVAQKG
jgi:hypothetical protein